MKSLFETLQQISLGLFVNGSYGLMQGDIDIQNILIVIVTTQSMYIFNSLKGKINGRQNTYTYSLNCDTCNWTIF